MQITQLDIPPYVCMLMTLRNIQPIRDPAHLKRHREINPLVHCELPAVYATKTQAMTLGKSQYPYNIFIGDRKLIEIERILNIGSGFVLEAPCCNHAEKSVC